MEKYIIILIILIILYFLFFNCDNIEKIGNTSSNNTNSDLVDSINNLGQLAKDIQKPTGLTLPASLNVTNNVDISGNLNVIGSCNLTSRIKGGSGIKVDISNNEAIASLSLLNNICFADMTTFYNIKNLKNTYRFAFKFKTTNNLVNLNDDGYTFNILKTGLYIINLRLMTGLLANSEHNPVIMYPLINTTDDSYANVDHKILKICDVGNSRMHGMYTWYLYLNINDKVMFNCWAYGGIHQTYPEWMSWNGRPVVSKPNNLDDYGSFNYNNWLCSGVTNKIEFIFVS